MVRRDSVLSRANLSSAARSKNAAFTSFVSFLARFYPDLHYWDSSPEQVLAFIAFREVNSPLARTIVHSVSCSAVGPRYRTSDCVCPKILKGSSVQKLVKDLSRALFEAGLSAPYGSFVGLPNPAASHLVAKYVKQVILDQKRVGVHSGSFSSPMFIDKLCRLLSFILTLSSMSSCSALNRAKLARDFAWFTIAFWTGVRGAQLACTLTTHLTWTTGGEAVQVTHFTGKTLREMDSSQVFFLPRRDDFPIACPACTSSVFVYSLSSFSFCVVGHWLFLPSIWC